MFDSENRIEILDLQIIHKYSMADYIRGGSQLGLVTCIDFTASNGDPKDSYSLHYIGDPNKNQYRNAIKSVG